jgi:hypothetical protein
MIKLVAIGLAIILGLIVIGSLLLMSVLVVFGCLAVMLGRGSLLRLRHQHRPRSRIIEAQYTVVNQPRPAVPLPPVRLPERWR